MKSHIGRQINNKFHLLGSFMLICKTIVNNRIHGCIYAPAGSCIVLKLTNVCLYAIKYYFLFGYLFCNLKKFIHSFPIPGCSGNF